MDLRYPEEAEAFRAEVRTWLEENLLPGWGEPDFEMTPEEREEFQQGWGRKLYEGGWVCATWPKEYGGRGLTTIQAVVLAEEFNRKKAPMRADFFGDTLVGPTILHWGTEDQKQRFLPGILKGQTRWCQGFSEPDAGSDLGSVRTTARLDGEEWSIDGQKTWTSHAQYADYCFVLARTDPEAPKHKGLSYILVPMRQPGVTVRPIQQMDGSTEFNEVFFEGVRAPKDNVVGGVGNGWKVAMTTLGFERGTSSTISHRRFAKEFDQILEDARAAGRADDPIVRQELARAWSRVKIMEVNGYRTLTDVLHGTEQARNLGPLNKLFWTHHHQHVLKVAADIRGLAGEILDGAEEEYVPGVGVRANRPGYLVNRNQAAFIFSRSETIWGGSSEIQRNVIGERVLGLPKGA